MKKSVLIFLLLSMLKAFGQIKQLNSGTTERLSQVSVFGKNIIITGISKNYLVKSYDECEQLIPITCPGAIINNNHIQRFDTNVIYLMSQGNGGTLFKSIDGGTNWSNKWSSSYAGGMAFFDTLVGLVSKDLSNQFYKTLDGGTTWTTITGPVSNITVLTVYGDSTIIAGGSNGNFFLSKDRGNTWKFAWGVNGCIPNDFSFLNSDTIVGIAYPYGGNEPSFMRMTTGNAWEELFAPIQYPNAIHIRSAKECFILGQDFGKAVIAKSTNLGETWEKLNTGINGELTQIAFLNDSIAILTGSGGILLRWNYKLSFITGLPENKLSDLEAKIYPNPTEGKIHVETDMAGTVVFRITDLLGKNYLTAQINPVVDELDLAALPKGIYFCHIESANKTMIYKLVLK